MRTRVTLLVFLAAAAPACGSILGLQEPTVDDTIEAGGDSGGSDGGGGDGGPSAPVVIAQNQGGPFMVAQSGSRVVWTNFIGSTVSSIDKFDGGMTLMAADPLADQPIGLAVDDSGVYFANTGTSGTVLHCGGATCAASDVVFDAGFTNTDLVRNGALTYFLQADNDEIDRMNADGSGRQSIATTDTNNFERFLARIATDGTNMYWTEPLNDTILRKPISGGSPTTIFTASSGASPSAVLVDGTTLYFAVLGQDNGQGTVSSSALDGSGVQTIAASQHFPYELAVDANYIYWTAEGDADASGNPLGNGGVFRCAKSGCGGNPDQLASNLNDARGIAVDDTTIYFATFETGKGDGKIWKMAKP
ncbi:MAG TPA: hypothetical protein VGH28_05305 [Polyangiaceae bacterium]|jgi:hypothetical protein